MPGECPQSVMNVSLYLGEAVGSPPARFPGAAIILLPGAACASAEPGVGQMAVKERAEPKARASDVLPGSAEPFARIIERKLQASP
jgi:hypothetical protein